MDLGIISFEHSVLHTVIREILVRKKFAFSNFKLHDQTSHKNVCFRIPYIFGTILGPFKLTACGCDFNIFHALTCHTGGFTIITLHEIHDFMANLSTEVCHDACVEPHIKPLSSEAVSTCSASNEGSARLDIAASGFWEEVLEWSFFDVRMFNPYAYLPSIPGFPGLSPVSACPPGILEFLPKTRFCACVEFRHVLR